MAAKKQKYEYKCVAIFGAGRRTSTILNEYAREGWELVTVVLIWHYLKREVNRPLSVKIG